MIIQLMNRLFHGGSIEPMECATQIAAIISTLWLGDDESDITVRGEGRHSNVPVIDNSSLAGHQVYELSSVQ